MLSQIEPVHTPHPSSWRAILILSPIYAGVSQVFSFPQVSQPQSCIHLSSPLYALHAHPSQFSRFGHRKNIGWAVQIYYYYYYYYVSISILFAICYSIMMHPVEMQWNSNVSLKAFQCTYCVQEKLLEWWTSLWLQVCHRELQHTATVVLEGRATL